MKNAWLTIDVGLDAEYEVLGVFLGEADAQACARRRNEGYAAFHSERLGYLCSPDGGPFQVVEVSIFGIGEVPPESGEGGNR